MVAPDYSNRYPSHDTHFQPAHSAILGLSAGAALVAPLPRTSAVYVAQELRRPAVHTPRVPQADVTAGGTHTVLPARGVAGIVAGTAAGTVVVGDKRSVPGARGVVVAAGRKRCGLVALNEATKCCRRGPKRATRYRLALVGSV